MTTSKLARPFIDSDWNRFCEAESWDNAHPPLVRYLGEDCFVIADRNGMEAHWPDEDVIYCCEIKFPTQRAAEVFLNELTESELREAAKRMDAAQSEKLITGAYHDTRPANG